MIGRIVDSISGEGVPFAYIGTDRGGQWTGTQADEGGNWSFGFLPGDLVRVASIGYRTAELTGAELSEGAGVVFLEEVAGELDPVIVTPHQDEPATASTSYLWLLLLVPLLARR